MRSYDGVPTNEGQGSAPGPPVNDLRLLVPAAAAESPAALGGRLQLRQAARRRAAREAGPATSADSPRAPNPPMRGRFCARSNARSIPAALTDDSYLASSIFFSGGGTEISCACPGHHAIEIGVDARRGEPLLFRGALRAVGEHLRIDPERLHTFATSCPISRVHRCRALRRERRPSRCPRA